MRNYRRKHVPQWRDKDKRMTLAVQMRGGGMSLREIAKELAVGHQTVIRDLRRWEESGGAGVVHFPGPSRPAGGNLDHPDGPPEAVVTELRRRA